MTNCEMISIVMRRTASLTFSLLAVLFYVGKTTLMNAINNGKLEGWPQHLKTAYVDSGSNVDPLYEAQKVMAHLLKDTGRSEADCMAKLKELDFTDNMIGGTIGALSGGWQMKLRLIRAILMDPDIFLLDEPVSTVL
jgi:elongation factor 3